MFGQLARQLGGVARNSAPSGIERTLQRATKIGTQGVIDDATRAAARQALERRIGQSANKEIPATREAISIRRSVPTVDSKTGVVTPADTISPAARTEPTNLVDALTKKRPWGAGLGDALISASDVGLNAPLNVTRKGMREVGKDANRTMGRLYDRTGSSNLEKIREVGKELTGGENSFMDEVTDAVFSNYNRGRKISTQGLMDDSVRWVNELPDTLGIDKKTFIGQIRSTISKDNPIKMANSMRSQASALLRKATVTDVDKAKSGVLNKVADSLEDRTYRAIPDNQVKSMYNDTIIESRQRAQSPGDREKSKMYRNLADGIEKIPEAQRTMENYRTLKKDFVQADKLGELSDQAGGGGSLINNVKKVPIVGDLAAAIAERPLNAASQAVGRGMRRTGQAFQDGSAQNLLKGAALAGGGLMALNALGGDNDQGEQSLVEMLSNTSAAQNTPPYTTNSAVDSEYGGGLNTGYQTDAPTTVNIEGLEWTLDDLYNGYYAALSASDKASASAFADIIESLESRIDSQMDRQVAQSKQDDGVKLSTAQQNNLYKMQAAANGVQELISMYDQAGGGQGRVGGTLSNILSKVGQNDAVSAYNQTASSFINTIKDAIGKTDAANTEPEVQRLMQMIPRIEDTKGEAQRKLTALNNYLQNNYKAMVSVYSGQGLDGLGNY